MARIRYRAPSLAIVGQTVLAQAAASLAPNGIASTAQGTLSLGLRNTGQVSSLDIQWTHTCLFHDPVRKELQYIGKPAQGQGGRYSHYVYSEQSNSWRTTLAAGWGVFGHPAWTPAFDPVNGDYYFKEYVSTTIHRYSRAADAWADISPYPESVGGIEAHGAAYHPNLYGTGDGGLVVSGAFGIWLYRRSTATWVELLNTSETGGNGGGGGCYVSGLNRVFLGTGSAGPLISVSSNAAPRVNLGAPPQAVFGPGGGTAAARIIEHPGNPSLVMLLEGIGSRRVWLSTDGASGNWTQPYAHPFTTTVLPGISDNQYTVGTIPAYGVVIALTSGHGGGGPNVAIWKPPA